MCTERLATVIDSGAVGIPSAKIVVSTFLYIQEGNTVFGERDGSKFREGNEDRTLSYHKSQGATKDNRGLSEEHRH